MLQTPLIEFHREQNARLVDFAGWEMPIMYSSIREEHAYTRAHGTLFDVSHMGRLEIRGGRAAEFLDCVCTRQIGNMQVGQSRYSHVCRADGGILDDIIVSCLEDHYLVVCNASNREKIVQWFDQHRASFEVELVDRTTETAMAALQGPEVMETMARILPIPLDDLKRYHFKAGSIMGAKYLIARSGYTGEDGVEIILPKSFALMAVRMLVSKSAEMERPIKPAGLGARDTLRLEAGMPLYGHELTEDWDPITAGQKWCCYLEKNFIGSDVVKRVAEEGPRRKVVGLTLEGRRIAREGARVLSGEKDVGHVTSGTHSPTLDRVIAMALVGAEVSEPGTKLTVDIRGAQSAAEVVPLPFYKRGK